MALSHEEKVAAIKRYRSDFTLFGKNCLWLLDKQGKRTAMNMNRAQRYVHEQIEAQRKKTGKVRALVLKGRQQGISTYIAARFYWRTTLNLGKSAFIVAHEMKATANLFKMVRRYHLQNPIAPSTGEANANELVFNGLDGGYKLATAGSKDVGRSNTAQFLHASEFAFWDNAPMHMAGLGNIIADLDDTEIIVESTANGLGNSFHQMWSRATRGEGEYIAIFVPWFWQEEYTAEVKPDFEESLSDDDREYMVAYGLSLGQMAWRANKIATYDKGFEWLFDQEYPACPELAFQSPTANPLITPAVVQRAVRDGLTARNGPLVIGCDPAGESGEGDATAIAFRRGRLCYRIESHKGLNTMQIAAKLAGYYAEFRPDAIFVDKGGLGAGVVDRLKELGVPVIGINFGESARDEERYANRRAEMWWEMRDWLMDAPSRIPDDPALIADLCSPGVRPARSNGQRLLESKEQMRARGLHSPDHADALALTFADPVQAAATQNNSAAGKPYRAASKAGY